MLSVGDPAPGFELAAADGERYALDHALTVAIFFKTSCPTCQYAWPYYERLYQAYHDAGLQLYGISQHNREKTRDYAVTYSATFPHLVDDNWAVSRQYDPEFVPTVFLISPDRRIVETFVSWNSEQLNQLSDSIARRLGREPKRIVNPEDNAIIFKPG